VCRFAKLLASLRSDGNDPVTGGVAARCSQLLFVSDLTLRFAKLNASIEFRFASLNLKRFAKASLKISLLLPKKEKKKASLNKENEKRVSSMVLCLVIVRVAIGLPRCR